MKRIRSLKETIKFIIYLITAVFIILNIVNSFDGKKALICRVVGHSMEPTLHSGQITFQNGYEFSRGDIVTSCVPETAIEQYPKLRDTHIIKRIVGMPGDTITIKQDGVYINDELYIEDYLPDESKSSTFKDDIQFKYITLSDSQYFLMGDNRANSYDSRYFGAVEKDLLLSVQREKLSEVISFKFNNFMSKYLVICDVCSVIDIITKKIFPFLFSARRI